MGWPALNSRMRKPSKSERTLCGARCRSKGGAPCVARVVIGRDALGRVAARRRCRMHGGLSTGARTEEGRSRLSEAGRRGAAERWRRWREAHAKEPARRAA